VKRIFWFGVGVATGVAVTRKATETARQATPSGLASNVGDAMRELGAALGSFGAEVRAGMDERESELQQLVERQSGMPVQRGRQEGTTDRSRARKAARPDGASGRP